VFFEEALFRGLFFGYLMKRGSAAKAIWTTSLFFAVWHFTPAFKVVTANFQIGEVGTGLLVWIVLLSGAFIAGLLFAWVRYRSRNIAGCILAHFLINILALTIMYWVWV
jgi:membrane protease YdiL (CAAX protease family)